MNEQNLIPTSQRSKSEARELGRKGGKASGEARRLKKKGRDLLRLLLDMPETDQQIVEAISKTGIAPADITNEVALHARQIEKAIRKADTKAYSAILKAAGYDTNDITINLNQGDSRPEINIE